MRQGTYLNVILTVNALLLTGLLWTQVASAPPVLTENAIAAPPPSMGIPNSAEQRQKMIESLREIRRSVDSTKRLLESGKIKVEVTNLNEIRIENPKRP